MGDYLQHKGSSRRLRGSVQLFSGLADDQNASWTSTPRDELMQEPEKQSDYEQPMTSRAMHDTTLISISLSLTPHGRPLLLSQEQPQAASHSFQQRATTKCIKFSVHRIGKYSWDVKDRKQFIRVRLPGHPSCS